MLSKFRGNSGVRRFLTGVLRGNRFTGLEYGHLGLGTAMEEPGGGYTFFTFPGVREIQGFIENVFVSYRNYSDSELCAPCVLEKDGPC